MSKKNLSGVATDVIATSGITATNVVNAARFGGERIVRFIDERFAMAVNRGAPTLKRNVRSNLIDGQQRVSGYYVKGVHFGTARAQSAIGFAVDLATKGVSLVAANAARFDRAARLNALEVLNRVALPAASAVSKVAERIEEGSSELVKRVAGTRVPAKAVAARKLKAATRKAATARKRVTQAATRRVSTVAAETATDTSNAARRVARQARTTGRRVGTAVAGTATEASNVARRVARKAKATGGAAA